MNRERVAASSNQHQLQDSPASAGFFVCADQDACVIGSRVDPEQLAKMFAD